MRDFLNEDELCLLRSNCLDGLLDLSEDALNIPEAQAFRLGSYEAFMECVKSKSISEIDEVARLAKIQESEFSVLNFDGRLDSKIDFQRAKYLQARFVLGCLFALRHVKDTLDPDLPDELHLLTPEHFAFVDLWRASEEILEPHSL